MDFVGFLNSFCNSGELLMSGKILLSVLLGGILGVQRERWGKSAGGRTYALVSAGAALFTLLSLHAFPNSDTSRVASQIVVGIGFLGAGIILHKEEKTIGLTTAAGLWLTAAIGMGIAAGYYTVSFVTTFLALLLLMIDRDKPRNALVRPPKTKKKKKLP